MSVPPPYISAGMRQEGGFQMPCMLAAPFSGDFHLQLRCLVWVDVKVKGDAQGTLQHVTPPASKVISRTANTLANEGVKLG